MSKFGIVVFVTALVASFTASANVVKVSFPTQRVVGEKSFTTTLPTGVLPVKLQNMSNTAAIIEFSAQGIDQQPIDPSLWRSNILTKSNPPPSRKPTDTYSVYLPADMKSERTVFFQFKRNKSPEINKHLFLCYSKRPAGPRQRRSGPILQSGDIQTEFSVFNCKAFRVVGND